MKTITTVITLSALLCSGLAASACIDNDGDGWGWNGFESCRLPSSSQCIDTPPVNDGWGWDGSTSCRIDIVPPVCVDTPPANDGWGWDGVASCRIEIVSPICKDTPPFDDDWGWNGTESCRFTNTTPQLQRVNGNNALISDDAQRIAFSTFSALIDNDTDDVADVYLQNNRDGSLALVRARGDRQQETDFSTFIAISGDGRYLVVSRRTSDPQQPSQTNKELYLFDTETETAKSIDTSGFNPIHPDIYIAKMSADGSVVVFQTLTRGGSEDIFLYRTANSELTNITEKTGLDGEIRDISGTGQFILLRSYLDADVYIYDTTTESINPLAGVPAAISDSLSISDDGQRVLYQSSGDSVVLDVLTGAQVKTIPNTLYPDLRPDGTKVVFSSYRTDLIPTPASGELNVFVTDISFDQTTLISKTIDGADLDGSASNATFNGSGDFIVFRSDANNLVENDTDGTIGSFIAATP